MDDDLPLPLAGNKDPGMKKAGKASNRSYIRHIVLR